MYAYMSLILSLLGKNYFHCLHVHALAKFIKLSHYHTVMHAMTCIHAVMSSHWLYKSCTRFWKQAVALAAVIQENLSAQLINREPLQDCEFSSLVM